MRNVPRGYKEKILFVIHPAVVRMIGTNMIYYVTFKDVTSTVIK